MQIFKTIKSSLRYIFFAGAIVLLVLSLSSPLMKWNESLELATHFRVHYLLASILTLPAILIMARLKKAFVVLLGLAFLINLMEIFPLISAGRGYPGAHAGSENSGTTKRFHSLKVLHSNVLKSNRKGSLLRKLIKAEKPDIVFVQEIDHWWAEELTHLTKSYKYFSFKPLPSPFGIGFLSRIPVHHVEYIYPGKKRPSLKIVLFRGEEKLTIISSHPPPPTGRQNTFLRNLQLEALGQIVNQIRGPVLLIGDLNTTMFSPNFKKMVQESRLKFPRNAGIQPTWPAFSYLPDFMLIPIDHCLAGGELRIISRRTGLNIGSDHLPLLCEIQIPDRPRVSQRILNK